MTEVSRQEQNDKPPKGIRRKPPANQEGNYEERREKMNKTETKITVTQRGRERARQSRTKTNSYTVTFNFHFQRRVSPTDPHVEYKTAACSTRGGRESGGGGEEHLIYPLVRLVSKMLGWSHEWKQ